MKKIHIYLALIFAALGFAACGDNDDVGPAELVDLVDFEFPQGNNPWDMEIEQIAADWGMYIIYKGVDSTHLNRRWSVPLFNDPIYVCKTPTDEQVQVYLELIRTWLLGNLDKNREEDRRQLPFYLYLVNDLDDGNPRSATYQDRHIRIKQDGMDYWSLSFTSEELAAGLPPETVHSVACTFSYPGMKARFETGEYEVAPGFADATDYESEIGRRYYSFEQWRIDNGPYMPEYFYHDNVTVDECDKDRYNAYLRRGFASQLGEDFKPVVRVGYTNTYGAPTWMPWIQTYNATYGFYRDVNPGPVAETDEERILADFMNIVRMAMTYPEAAVREMYPVDAADPLDRDGYRIINDKYDLVVGYMMTAYGVDLQKYGEILGE